MFPGGRSKIAVLLSTSVNIVLRLRSNEIIKNRWSCFPQLMPLSRNSSHPAVLRKGALRKMKLDEEVMKKLITPELELLSKMFKQYGFELRMAGGAVRDLLVNNIPADIDFATTATPEEMKQMFEKEQIRMINAKGEKHGTITARIHDKDNFEITTLRIDVVTDGRHAEVEFTKNWELDAGRRDLTINSMFLDLDGVVYDYFNGANDLKNCLVRFVGEPSQRIQEDYLRILRYFRFYGKIARDNDDHEEKTLKCIQDNVGGLQQISGERIWVEFRKILQGNFAGELVLKMMSLGIGPFIGLDNNPNIDEFMIVYRRIKDLKLNTHPITLLSALLKTDQSAIDLNARLKLSAFERDLAIFIILHRNELHHANPLRECQRLVILSKSKQSDVRSWIEELLMYQGAIETLDKFKDWIPPKFPVSGHTLIENKVSGGNTMSKVLLQLKEIWIESDFTATKDELAAHLPQILSEMDFKKKR